MKLLIKLIQLLTKVYTDDMIDELKILANKCDVPYQSLLKIFLSERIDTELHQHKGLTV